MGRRSRTRAWIALAVVLALTGTASADHLKRKDRAILGSIARMSYTWADEMTFALGECQCLEPTCDGGFMISCGGEMEPAYSGLLTAVRRTSRETCYVCGCAVDLVTTMRATSVCLGY